MNIEFFIPRNKIVPTELRLLVNNKIHVYYKPLEDEFGYLFNVYCAEHTEEAERVVKHIAEMMCYQSYDHGSEWRVVQQTTLSPMAEFWDYVEIKVTFRVKDAG